MDWIPIENEEQLNQFNRATLAAPDKAFVLFKHSTRCLTSKMAKNMFSGEYHGSSPVYLLHVIENRAASNYAATLYQVHHESPQVLIIKNGRCIYDASHSAINAGEIMRLISEPA